MSLKLALAGNPNCGKTTLFNAITGSRQYVGNWPGVTVEKKTGKVLNNDDIDVVDLPGIYSLSPYSAEEIVARNCILGDDINGIINIIDGTNIERNLYLTLQLLELKKPTVIAFNMIDELSARGTAVDFSLMSALLGVPIVPVSAKKKINTDKLISVAKNQAGKPIKQNFICYGLRTDTAINKIRAILSESCRDDGVLDFYAAKLLEKDAEIEKRLDLTPEQKAKISQVINDYERLGDSAELIANARYDFITENVVKSAVKRQKKAKTTITQIIDSVVLNRFLAIPIFALIIVFIFALTFGSVGTAAQKALNCFFEDTLPYYVSALLDCVNAPSWTYGLLIDAVIGGIGGVLSFTPQITVLFFCLSLLEDSGYIARAAFIMDGFMQKIGLSGKSFIPMLMGFGCTTPAVMAARTMENRHERRMTILLTPFMSCGARLTVYALFAGVFFKNCREIVICSIYLIGIVFAGLCGIILKKSIFKNTNATFVLELPPYRIPSLKTLIGHVWERVKGFIIKAGTLIFSMSVLIWLFQNVDFSLRPVNNPENSILGIVGKAIAPIFAPIGFASWQAVVSLFTGLVAKESVVSTLSVLYSVSGLTLEQALMLNFTPLSAYSFMVFTLLYVPCISAFAAIRKEMNSAKWTAAAIAVELVGAYAVSGLIYTVGGAVIRAFQ